jgi:DNA (cytosine-5)-methyltransferase 1
VLDAQYFGVAQRRRRVFVVGYLGDWRRAAAVLFERESMSGHPAPSREAKQDVAGYTSSSFGKYSEGVGTIRAAGGDLGGGSETLVTAQDIVNTITASYGMGGPDFETKPLVYGKSTNRMRGFGDYIHDETASALKARDYKDATDLIAFPAEMSGTQAASTPEMSPTLSVGHTTAVAFAQNQAGELRESDVFNTLNTNSNASGRNTPLLRSALQVRRLTPIECERLQGFPDNYTRIPYRNKSADDCPDGPRYKAMGNSMAVPVMRWIGERIDLVNKIQLPDTGNTQWNPEYITTSQTRIIILRQELTRHS